MSTPAKPSRGQLAKIHIMAKQAGLDDVTYREMLCAVTGKSSCSQMSYMEASRVIEHLARRMGHKAQSTRQRAKGKEHRAQSTEQRARKYEDLGSRPGMATPSELRKIEAMWAEVAYGNPKATLRRFLFRGWRCSDPRFLTARQAWEAIEAVKQIQRRRGLKGLVCGGR